jgi:HK97 family phage major capsid protein
MSAKLRALQARKAAEIEAAREFNDATEAKASAENRAWTDDESAKFAALTAAAATTTAAIDREQALAAEEAGMAAVARAGSGSVDVGAAASVHVAENVANDPKRGFQSFGDFAAAVLGASRAIKGMGGQVDKRLTGLGGGMQAAAPTTFGNEAAGADGGFLIPPDFSKNIFQLSLGEDALLPMTDDVDVAGNSMVFPKDETTPWGSTGIRAYWQGEATAGTQTKPVLGQAALRLKKLMALVPVTDELLQDTTALGSYLPKKVGLSIRWKANEAILWGTGGPQPQGALNSGASITVAKESGQSTLTLQPMNLAKMVARLPAGSYPNAVWVMNNDVLPYLFTLNNNNQIYYLPYGGGVGAFQGSPYGTLLGRPIIVSQHAKSFTNAGDVNLLDLSYYQAITKAEGVQIDTSMHLYFDADAMAFRTIFRMDGQSKLSAAVSPANGSNTLSPFVQLGAR